VWPRRFRWLEAHPPFLVKGTDKGIPKFQRRGAIIVLGMFAAPKPEVVAEHVDILLKIGLGPHGKVSTAL
jgi:condensin complex subunit 1